MGERLGEQNGKVVVVDMPSAYSCIQHCAGVFAATIEQER
jgi:hypothetical protein